MSSVRFSFIRASKHHITILQKNVLFVMWYYSYFSDGSLARSCLRVCVWGGECVFIFSSD